MLCDWSVVAIIRTGTLYRRIMYVNVSTGRIVIIISRRVQISRSQLTINLIVIGEAYRLSYY